MGCTVNCCATTPRDATVPNDLINGIEFAIEDNKNQIVSSSLEKIHEKYKEQDSNQKIESKVSSNSKNNNSQNQIIAENLNEIEIIEKKKSIIENHNSLHQKTNTINSSIAIEEINRQGTKKTTKTNEGNFHMIVGPEIFVSLKKGIIAQFYDIGKTLGEEMVRAMKSMKKSSLLKEEEKKMFAEMNILKDLDHPNIVKLYELFQDDENYFLITEYCCGGELFDRIKSMSNFSEKIAAEYLKQILSAVVYCHSKKIVHRDLKPENLIFDSKLSNATLKVIDFGTSRKFDSNTKMTKRLGTPYYIAPEVLNKNYNEKCDVWSCGIILYILLCGYPPFTGKSEEDILKKVKIGKYRYDPEEWGKVSQEGKSLIDRLLTIDPEKRISAQDALNDSWIQKNSINQPLNTKVLTNLGNFAAKTKLQAALYTFIATQIMSQGEKSELERTFKALDKDGDGRLSIEELIEGYIKIYGEGEREKAINISKKIISDVDQNYSGSIDFTEFLVAALNEDKLMNKTKIEQAFKMFDADGDGFITREELETIIGGVPIDETTWKAILDESDANKDGKISNEEFLGLLLIKFD